MSITADDSLFAIANSLLVKMMMNVCKYVAYVILGTVPSEAVLVSLSQLTNFYIILQIFTSEFKGCDF